MTLAYEFDYNSVTTFTMKQEIIRGTYKNASRNDQLYIWIRKKDADYLDKHFADWLHIDQEVSTKYVKITVGISVEKKYPMAIVYKTGSPETSELTISEIGNISQIEYANVEKVNVNLAPEDRIEIEFGMHSAKSVNEAFNLGMRYKQYCVDLQDLGYIMISTPESGLITST